MYIFESNDIYIVLIAGLAVILISLIVGGIVNDKRKKIVCNTSIRLKAISKINSKYDFYDIEGNKVFQKVLSSKSQYDNYRVSKHLEEIVPSCWETLVANEKLAKENQRKYASYLKEIQDVPNYTTPEFAKINKVKYNKYVEIENELIKECILHPVVEIEYSFNKYYSSPQGRNYYSHQEEISFQEIKDAKQRIEKKNQYKKSREYQRSIMTPKLRYSVLQRDGFRCVLCGRDARQGVTLEVDHIIPISKGGLTEYSNLRTLCRDCNRGKADGYEPGRMN